MKIVAITAAFIFVATALFVVSTALAEKENTHDHGTMTAGDKTEEKTEVTRQATCPVMGGKINKDLYVDAEGKRIYVCCKGCISKVKENPEKYIRKLEEQGVTLKSLECRMQAKAVCPMTKECPKKNKVNCPKAKPECPMGEKQESHKGHHENKK